MAAYRTTIRDTSDTTSYRLPSMAGVAKGRGRLPEESGAFHIDLMLAAQRCMDPLSLLNELYERVSQYLPVEGFSWRQEHDEVSTPFFRKDASGHCVLHNLELTQADVRLGELAVCVERSLSEEESAWMFRVAQSIAFALRNTLLFQKALFEANQDPLTGLKNRRVFDSEVAREQARFVRYNIKSSLVVMDLNGLKSINDTWGHDVGDRAIRLFADGLQQVLRDTDQAFRFGGDEFCAILPSTNLYGAKKMAERLDSWLAAHELSLPSRERITVRTAFGLAETEKNSDEKDWFRRADQSLYHNKLKHKRTAA
ncbi:MAG: GGDEF domain-containing protein [Halothiobacillus sp.]|nr:GGDEF domain-containing protein [Halothiobacillus sp.]